MKKHFLKELICLFILSLCFVPLMASAQITIKKTNVPLEIILNDIESKTNYVFLYNDVNMNGKQNMSINVADAELNVVLDKLFKGTDISYTVKEQQIILKNQEPVTTDIKEQRKLEGVVKDEKGEALIGVSIVVKGKLTGTVTDERGKFSLMATNGDVLMVSYTGFVSKQVKINNQKVVEVILAEDDVMLEEVVVTALGIKRSQKALSYNVQEIKAEDVTSIKDANFINSLAGKVAGVNINSSASGIGGASKVVMRGPKSINGNNNAMYVIDGIPISNVNNGGTSGEYSMQPRGEGISDLNPEDIESMTILTGAAAAALYGSSAANGAILITTKSGVSGKARITVTNNTTFMKPFVMPKFQNRYGNKLGSYSSWGDKLATPSSYDPKDFFNTGSNIQNSISLAVGNDRNQTYISMGTTNADGIILNNSYNRYNFTFRNTTKFLEDKMTLDVGASYIRQNDRNMMAQGKYFNPLTAVYTFPRGESFDAIRQFERWDEGRNIMAQSWQYGSNGLDMQNPYWVAKRNLYENNKERYMLNATLKYDLFDWLNVAGRVRLDNNINVYTKKYSATTAGLFAGPKGFFMKENDKDNQVYADLMANVNKRFNTDWNLVANLGTSLNRNKTTIFGFQGPLKFVSNAFNVNNIDVNGRDARGFERLGTGNFVNYSVFASAEMGWKSMLYLTLTGRYDWDSTLSGMPQEGFFYPSVGVSAVISQMVKLPEAISYLKVRGSWSSVGAGIPRYISYPTYGKDPSTQQQQTSTHYPLSKLHPEKTDSWEIGLSSKFLENRLGLEVTYYHSNTKNQTHNMPISAVSGYSSWYIQTGNVENKGLELALTANNKFGDFGWNSALIYSFNKNKIKKLFDDGLLDPLGNPVETAQIGKGGMLSSEIILKEGGTIGDMYTKTALKRDQEGNYWVDPTGGLVIENNVIEKVGSVLPKGNLAWRNDFAWKGLDFGFAINARFGGIVVSPTQAILDGFGVSEASALARDNGGIPVNNGMVDAQKWYETVGTGTVLSHYVYSATNVRLQEARIGYTLPKKWFNNAMTMNVAVVGRNLWMIYNKAPFDPELTASTGTYYQGLDYFMQPSLRNIGFSVKLQF